MVEQGFKVVFKGDAESLEAASASAATSIGNVLKAAAKVSQLDSFKSLSQSANKAVANINAITGDLNKIRIDYTLPNFDALQRLIGSVKKDINSAFVSVVPQPDTSPFTRAIAAMVASAQQNLNTLRNTRINMGAIQPPDLSQLKRAVEIAKADLSKAVIVRFPPVVMPTLAPVVVPPVNKVKFDASVNQLAGRVEAANTIIKQLGTSQVEVPAVLPPNLQPLTAAVQKAKANIESVRLIKMPAIQLPVVPPLDERNFDASAKNIAVRVAQVNTLFKGISQTPINAPALIPFDVAPLRTAVQQAKAEIQAAKAIQLPRIETPVIHGLDTAEMVRSVTNLQGQVERANNYLSDFAKTDIPTPVLPVPSLQPLFTAVDAAKKAILESGTILLPKVEMPTLQPVAIPALEDANFNKSVSNLQSRVASINTTLKTVSTTPIIPPAVMPLDIKPLYAAVADVKRKIAEVRFNEIRLPTIEAISVPPVNARDFDNSTIKLIDRVNQVNAIITGVDTNQITVPPVIPPSIEAFRKVVLEAQDLIRQTSTLKLPFIESPKLKPIDTTDFVASADFIKQRVATVQAELSRIAGTPISTPELTPPKLDAIRDSVKQVRLEIARAAQIQLPRIETPVVPAIDRKQFETSYADIRTRISTINALFASIDNTAISAPLVAAPDFSNLLAAVQKAKTNINAVFLDPIPTTAFTTATQTIKKGIQQLDNLSFDLALPVPSDAALMAISLDARHKLQSLWSAPLKPPVLTPPVIPTLPAIKLPPLDAFAYTRNITDAIAAIRADAAKGVILKIDATDTGVLSNIQHLVLQLNTTPITIPVNVQAPNFTQIKAAVAAAKKDLSFATLVKLPAPTIGKIKIPKIPPLANPFAPVVTGGVKATQAITNFGSATHKVSNGLSNVSNVLAPIVANLGNLSQASTSSVGSLAGLAASLVGSGGIAIALGIVATLIETFGDKLLNTRSAADVLREAQDAARKATEDFVATLSDVARARLEGAQNAQKELVSVEALYKASQNQNLSLGERKKAVDALQAQYPAYFKNISDETILAGGATKAYNTLTTAILAAAKARAVQDRLAQVQGELLTNDEQKATALKDEEAAYKRIKTLRAQTAKAVRNIGVSGQLEQGIVTTNALGDAEKGYKNAVRATQKALEDRNILLDKATQLANNLSGFSVDALIGDVGKTLDKVPKGEFNFFDKFFDTDYKKLNLSAKKVQELTDAAKAFRKEFENNIVIPKFDILPQGEGLTEARKFWADFVKGIVTLRPPKIDVDFTVVPTISANVDLLPRFIESLRQEAERESGKPLKLGPDVTYDINRKEILDNYKKIFKALGRDIPKMIEGGGFDKSGRPILLEVGATTDLKQLEEGLDEASNHYVEKIKQLRTTIGETLTQMQSDVLVGLGNTIGAALAGGGLDGVFKNLFATLGSGLETLGQYLIKTAIQLKAVKMALGPNPNPLLLAAAGIALVGIGSALRYKLSQGIGLKEGGIINPYGTAGVDKYPAMLSAREAVVPLDRLSQFIETGNGNNSGGYDRIRLRGADLELSRARNSRRDRRIR